MVKHIILWQLKDELSGVEESRIKSDLKVALEGLVGKIPGLIELKIQTEKLSSSNADIMLDSTFESEETLKEYAVHPDHVYVADKYVRPYTKTRMCIDYEI